MYERIFLNKSMNDEIISVLCMISYIFHKALII